MRRNRDAGVESPRRAASCARARAAAGDDDASGTRMRIGSPRSPPEPRTRARARESPADDPAPWSAVGTLLCVLTALAAVIDVDGAGATSLFDLVREGIRGHGALLALAVAATAAAILYARRDGTAAAARHAEAIRQRSRLDAALEAADAGAWEWDLLADVLTIDARCAEMLGRRALADAPLAGDRWRALVHADDLAGIQRATAACLATPAGQLCHKLRLRHADGHWIVVRTSARVSARDAAGRALALCGVHVDVTAVRAVERALADREAIVAALLDLSPAGVAVTDLETGRFLEVNEAFARATGYPRAELLLLCDRDLAAPSSAADDTGELQVVDDGDRFGPHERRQRRKDGSTYPAIVSGIRGRDASGRAVAWTVFEDISQRRALEVELADLARRDRLTGLANRLQFTERLQKAVRRVRDGRQALFAVLFLDFDRFKLINDTMGHDAGDEMLRQIAARLQVALGTEDSGATAGRRNVLARSGGDEFLVLLNDLETPADAARVAERLLERLAPAYEILGAEVRSSASIGIVASGRAEASVEEVLRNADVAMYEAKRSGRGCAVTFNDEMHTRLARRVAIEAALHRAVGSDELAVVYQPIVDLESGRMVSVEALVRWHHPELGSVSPAEFIPIAEECGLVGSIDRWVLGEALRAFATWRRTDPDRAPATVSVNISRAELVLGRELVDQVRTALEREGLPAACLQLEVTEREVMRDPEGIVGLMAGLHALGVRLAMDDFGTGTSSLRLLHDYPFDTVKIDRSFVKDLGAGSDVLAVVHATVRLIENLGRASLAEGVEEPAQLAILQTLGCRYAQGYLFSRPVGADRVLSALDPPSEAPIARTG
jgi:diguanylate cyclase (GGDEF)-like protein/PAS domain S-box-containing protein